MGANHVVFGGTVILSPVEHGLSNALLVHMICLAGDAFVADIKKKFAETGARRNCALEAMRNTSFQRSSSACNVSSGRTLPLVPGVAISLKSDGAAVFTPVHPQV